jgi:putative transposase
MISASDRQEAMTLIREAVQAGARQALPCEEHGVSARTLQRWQHQAVDGRPDAQRPAPPNKLSEEERRAVLDAAYRADFASLTLHQIVPRLADEGISGAAAAEVRTSMC